MFAEVGRRFQKASCEAPRHPLFVGEEGPYGMIASQLLIHHLPGTPKPSPVRHYSHREFAAHQLSSHWYARSVRVDVSLLVEHFHRFLVRVYYNDGLPEDSCRYDIATYQDRNQRMAHRKLC